MDKNNTSRSEVMRATKISFMSCFNNKLIKINAIKIMTFKF